MKFQVQLRYDTGSPAATKTVEAANADAALALIRRDSKRTLTGIAVTQVAEQPTMPRGKLLVGR